MIMTTLGELSVDGGNYGIAAPAVEYSSNLPTYLRITDICDDGTLDLSNCKSVDSSKAYKYILHENDIVFARTGNSTGRNYFYDRRDGEFVYAGFLIKFSLNPERVNPRYIKYYVQSQFYWDWIASYNTGSTRGNINAKTYESMPIVLPSRDVQDRIVKICDSISNKIRNSRLLNDYLEKLGQVILNVYLDSCNKKVALRSILDLGNGFAFKSGAYEDDGIYKILTIKNVQNGIVDCSSSNRINNYPTKMKEHCKLNIGDVVLSLTGNVGRVGIVAERNCLLNQRVAVLKPKNKIFLSGLYFLFRKDSFQHELIGIAKGTAQANLSPVETLRVAVPYEEKSFVTACSKLNFIFNLILKNRIEVIALNKLRDLLLKKLISGEYDLSKIVND
jgi:hypothetical protein BACCOPRO_00673